MSLPPRAEDAAQNMLAAFEDSDYEKMEEIRARVDAIVGTARPPRSSRPGIASCASARASTTSTCRPSTAPNTTLVDTDGKGVERITERGVVVAGVEYPVDCIIYASGFEVGTEYQRRAGFDLTGRGGLKLSEHWAQGMRTKHGIHVHGFPNAFIVQPTQGANLISNVPHNLTEAGKTIATIVRHALDVHAREVEVTKEAEDAWVALLLSGPGMLLGSQDCTPGLLQQRGPGSRAAREAQRRLSGGRPGVLSVPRRVAAFGPLRWPGVSGDPESSDNVAAGRCEGSHIPPGRREGEISGSSTVLPCARTVFDALCDGRQLSGSLNPATTLSLMARSRRTHGTARNLIRRPECRNQTATSTCSWP